MFQPHRLYIYIYIYVYIHTYNNSKTCLGRAIQSRPWHSGQGANFFHHMADHSNETRQPFQNFMVNLKLLWGRMASYFLLLEI